MLNKIGSFCQVMNWKCLPLPANIFPIILFRNSGNNHLLFSNLIPIILVIILNSQSKIILIVKICYCTVA